jgi:uncharacterized membrane protein YjjP (DUF1212 family)
VEESQRRSLPGGLSIPELAEYLVDVGATLSAYGNPTHRTEGVIRLIAELEGCACDVFVVPTGLWLSVRGPGEEQPVVRMARVKDWGLNLDRLAAVDRIFNDVIDRKLSLAEARLAIDDVEKRPLPYPRLAGSIAHAGAAAAAAVFFRGGLLEVLLAGLGGLLLVLVFRLLRQREGASLLADFVGGVVAAALAWAATSVRADLSREVVVLSVIILLVPGMVLTTGLAELANRNLISGAGRLMEAFIVFLSILFGIACVIALESALGGSSPGGGAPRDMPAWWLQAVAMLVSAVCFGVLFNVPRQHLAPAMASGAIGWIVTGQATRYLPGSLAAFAAALSVTLWANACARATQRPAQVFLLPGLVLLVPGSFGFLSLEAFLRGEFLGGAAKGFEMFLVAGAIVTGLLLANVVLPARKVL